LYDLCVKADLCRGKSLGMCHVGSTHRKVLTMSQARQTCSSCGAELVSSLSIAGRCEQCGLPICSTCWNLSGVRTCVEHTKKSEIPFREEPASSKEERECGLCGRSILSEASLGGHCEHEDCDIPICRTCWADEGRSCRQHILSHNEKLERARRDLEAGEIEALVTAEQARIIEDSFVSRFKLKAKRLGQVAGPNSKLVKVSVEPLGAPNGHDVPRQRTRRSRRGVRSGSPEHVPANKVVRFTILSRAGIRAKREVELVVTAQCHSHIQTYARDGFDTQPATRSELMDILSVYEKEAQKSGRFQVVGIISPTGWTRDAMSLIYDHKDNARSFASEHLAPCICLPTEGKVIHNKRDRRIKSIVHLFEPELPEEQIARVVSYVEEKLVLHDSLSLQAVVEALKVEEPIGEQAFQRLAENQGLVLDRFDELGLVISRKPDTLS